MITNYGKKMEEVQNQVTSLDSRLKEIDKMLCSRVDPSLRRRGGLDRTVPRSQWKAVLYFFGELLVAVTFAVVAIEIMKRFGLHGTTSE